ncbi:MAG TPA: hypothetical protein VFE62_28915 [Gemmataceae bacterium]|nr:hypothetical protein [Gemmataceae bacterium]
MRFVKLMKQLWQDDCGAIITAEYMMLGTVLTLGTVQGLATLRDSTNQDLQDMATSAREARQYYSPQLPKNVQAQTAVNQSAPSSVSGARCVGGVCP